MTAEMLQVCWNITNRIEEFEGALRRNMALVDGLGRVIDGLPYAPSYESRTEKLAASIVDLEKAIGELEMIRAECAAELAMLLNGLAIDAAAREVLFRRYGRCQRFLEIAHELCYSESHVYYLHRRGLAAVGVI